MKKVTYQSYQPSLLVNKIKKTKFERAVDINHALKLTNIIIHKSMEQSKSLLEYIDLSSDYLKYSLTEKYHKVLKVLMEENIIQPFEWNYIYKGNEVKVKYKSSKEQCKRYRINPELTQKCNYIPSPFLTQIDLNDLVDPNFKAQVITLIEGISIDLTGALLFIDQKIESISERDFKINNQVEGKAFELNFNGKKFYIAKDKALELGRKESKSVIQDGKEYYLDNINKYIEIKKDRIKFYYTTSIKKLFNKIIYTKRNKTNLRLDTNITQLPSDLISFLTYKGQPLINLDLSNSQFSILTYLISFLISSYQVPVDPKIYIDRDPSIYLCVLFSDPRFLANLRSSDINKEVIKMFTNPDKLSNICAYFFDQNGNLNPDVLNFMKSSQKGELYEAIVLLLNPDRVLTEEEEKRERKNAKKSMFEISFSSHKANSEKKELVKQAYPSICKFITEFKKEFGDNQFSILLQIIESTIFIDIIYPELNDNNISALSKHDSFLVPANQRDQTYKIITGKFEELGLIGKLGIEQEKTQTYIQMKITNEKTDQEAKQLCMALLVNFPFLTKGYPVTSIYYQEMIAREKEFPLTNWKLWQQPYIDIWKPMRRLHYSEEQIAKLVKWLDEKHLGEYQIGEINRYFKLIEKETIKAA